MEKLARSYLNDVGINDNYISGIIDNEDSCKSLMRDIDCITGGFVHKWTNTVVNSIRKTPTYFLLSNTSKKLY